KTFETGPITNHVNFATNAKGTFAYITIGGLNEGKVFRTDTFEQVATIPVGRLPHRIWGSGDGSRGYVGLEKSHHLAALDSLTNKVIATIPIGQAAQAVNYVPNAVPEGDGKSNLQPLGLAGETAHLTLTPTSAGGQGQTPTSVSLFDQGLIQILQASVTGLQPKKQYLLALAAQPDGEGALEPIAAFMTNPAGAAVVNGTGSIRQIVGNDVKAERRYLVIVEGTPDKPGAVVQRQTAE